MTGERVTIGITSFNAENTILRAVHSAVIQDWNDKEIIVVDDCSSDRSANLVEDFASRRENVRLIRHRENEGAAAARNTILENATGDFVAFFDDDDVSLPNRVRKQVERLRSFGEQNPEVLAICYAAGERRYANGYLKSLPAIGAHAGTEPRGTEVADYLLFFQKIRGREYGSGTPSCSMMASMEVFQRFGKFDKTFRRVEDVEFAIRAALSGIAFIGTPEVLFVQYSTDGEDKTPEKNRDSEIILAEKFREYLEDVGIYYYAKNWPLLRYYHFRRRYGLFLLMFSKIALRHPIRAFSHLLQVGPSRLRHEASMRRKQE